MVVVDRINLANGPSDSGEGQWQTRCTGRSPRICGRRIESGLIAPGSQLPTELELREQIQRLTQHGPRRHQVAHQPRPRRDAPGTGHLRRREDRPVRHYAVRRSQNRLRRRRGHELSVGSKRQEEDADREPDPAWKSRKPRLTSPRSWGRRSAAWSSADTKERYIDGTPWSMQTSFYPMEFVERGAVRLTTPEDIEEGTVQYLAEHPGRPPGRVIATGSWSVRRTPTRQTSSGCRRTAGPRSSR